MSLTIENSHHVSPPGALKPSRWDEMGGGQAATPHPHKLLSLKKSSSKILSPSTLYILNEAGGFRVGGTFFQLVALTIAPHLGMSPLLYLGSPVKLPI